MENRSTKSKGSAIADWFLIGCIFATVLILFFWLFCPIMAAKDIFSPYFLIVLPFYIYGTFFLLMAVGLVSSMLAAKHKAQKLSGLLVVSSLTCMAIFHIALTRLGNAGGTFLDAFSKRVKNEVGQASLDTMFLNYRNEVKSGKRVGSPVQSSDIPVNIRNLFKSIRPTGDISYSESDKDVFRVTIMWGGPFLSWGIVVIDDVPIEAATAGKAIVRNVSTNSIVFIGK